MLCVLEARRTVGELVIVDSLKQIHASWPTRHRAVMTRADCDDQDDPDKQLPQPILPSRRTVTDRRVPSIVDTYLSKDGYDNQANRNQTLH